MQSAQVGHNPSSLHDAQRTPHGWLLALTAVAALTLGYHPSAEDGGLYLAGVKHLLRPALYPHYTGFVTGHLRFSLFAPVMAALVRALHIGLPWTVLLVYLFSLWLLLYAAWQIAARCFAGHRGRLGAVALTAVWCGLPIAGTSLMLMDPCVTARSLTTPLALLGAAEAMDLREQPRRALLRCGLWLALATCLHPLMAAYAIGFVVLLACTQAAPRRLRLWSPVALGIAAILAAGALQLLSPKESASQTAVAATRYYWFPLQWQVYEWIGLLAPLLVLAALRRSAIKNRSAVELISATLWLGVISAAVAFAFARLSLASHMVARLQPLRCFQLVYVVMLILLGGWVAERLRRQTILATALLAVAGLTMFFGVRQYAPASLHLELPGRAPRNRWVQAFLWIRNNTPIDALFAMDANYITTDGEDAQCFRAIAERSAVPDYSKDGGETSITPGLTAAWTIGHTAQTGLSEQTDAERRKNLTPLGVSWLVLKRQAQTQLRCPYANDTVKVCRMR